MISIISIIIIHFLLPVIKIIHFPWTLSGIIPILSGSVLNLVADRYFKNAGTTVKPFEKSIALVTGGVFRISRHPMYLGMFLILAGISILLGSLTPFLIAAAFPFIMEAVFIKKEEKMLEDTFSLQYRAYQKKVRRWI